jgi:RNA polymerase sigma-70 factor, ECF subfamily
MDDSELRFQKIYEEYHDRICRYLQRMVGEGEAEDLTQDVFVKIGRGLESFRGESQLSTWIYQVATNAALDRMRSSRREFGKRISMEEISETENDKDIWTGEQKASTEQTVIRQEMNGCIRNIIDTLPDTDRLVILLSELEGFKDGEIASIIGLGLRATKIRLHRARVKLKNELNKACEFYHNEHNEFACDRKSNGD